MTQQKNLTEAKEIAAKSGNSFHAKVLLALKGAGWEVLVSPYYNDQATGKPREVDLIAEKAFVTTDTFDQPKGTIHIQLYIECKYLNQTTVLWTHLQDCEATLDMLEKKTPLRRTYSIVNDHHYLRQPDNLVVKLFAGQSGQSTVPLLGSTMTPFVGWSALRRELAIQKRCIEPHHDGEQKEPTSTHGVSASVSDGTDR